MALIKPIFYLLLAGGCVTLAAYLLQERMIFYPQKGIFAPDHERYAPHEIRLRRQSGRQEVNLHGWLLQPQKQKQKIPASLLIYYGGNAEEVSLNLGELERLPVDALLLINYRGYGLSEGRPGETDLVADALWVLDTITARLEVAPQQVVLMGRSLGTGVAVQVAARRSVAGLILVTPFDSLVSVARKHYPFLPVGRLLRHRFDSLSLAPGLMQPALMLMAAADTIIPSPCSQRLVDAWGGEVSAVTLPDAGHNDIHLSSPYWAAIDTFLHKIFP
jgi:pimeloyl-ACP methyl ester carboxylesterase